MKTIFTFLLVCLISDRIPTHLNLQHLQPVLSGSTTDPSAREDFEKGLLLLHNFEYPDARELFQRAQRKDPGYAMAYWGEAMTFNHPVWHNQDTESARKVLSRYDTEANRNLSELSPLEADLLSSLRLLYGEGKKVVRDKKYADFMGGMFGRHTGNHDVAAFYALSLLGMTQGWDAELCNKAAEISTAILQENPKHPGALHYYIHAEDHPEYARLAWQQANDYAKVASYSGHALHMPSHIYLALGLWDDVVRSNEVSWQAGVDRKEAKKLTNDALNYHGHWWLEYGYLQQGRFANAHQILQNQLRFTRERPSVQARNHFVIMKGHYLMETNDWQNSTALEQVQVNDLRLEIRTLHYFLQGLSAFRKKEKSTVDKFVQQITTDVNNSRKLKLAEDGITVCMAGPGLPGNSSINQAAILQEELTALSAFLNKDIALAKQHFEKAIDLEAANGYFFGPPETLKTTYEFYGEFLLAINEAQPALANFEKALQKAPGRNQSLRGVIAAAHKTGDTLKEREASKQLKLNLRAADSPEIASFFASGQ